MVDTVQGTASASEDSNPIPLSDLPVCWDDIRLLLHEPFLTHFALRKAIEEETYKTRRPTKEDVQVKFYVAMWNERADMVNNLVLFFCFGGLVSDRCFVFPTCRGKPTNTGYSSVSV